MVLLRWSCSQTTWIGAGNCGGRGGTILCLVLLLFTQISLSRSDPLHSNQGCTTLHMVGGCRDTPRTTRGIRVTRTVPIGHMDVQPHAIVVLFLRGDDSMARNMSLFGLAGRLSIHYAPSRTQGITLVLSDIPQTTSQVYQSTSL